MKKSVVFVTLFIILTLMCTAVALAAPPCPGIKTLVQPEGQRIAAVLKGDEWFHWYETADGEAVVRGKDGWWRFAAYENGALKPLAARAGVDAAPAETAQGKTLEKASHGKTAAMNAARSAAISARSSSIKAPTGPEKLLVILVSFSDVSIRQSDAYWSGKMFADYAAYDFKTDAHSSVNDYYREVSGGKFYFTPAGESSGAGGDGMVRVTLPMAHPAFPDDLDLFGADSHAVALAALNAADPYVNYQAFDTDGNGELTPDEVHIVMILAGGEQAALDPMPAVWAHSYGLSALPELDGVHVGGDYTEQGEYQGGHPATIGVLSHELGHSLGLPDLYDNGYESLGIGVYSLMANGSWGCNAGSYDGSSPTHLDAWCKALLGFTTPEAYGAGAHALRSVGTGRYNAIRLDTTDPEQYFLLENRQFSWGYDRSLSQACVSGGVAVWHIDTGVLEACGWQNVNDNETHKAVDLEEANEGILGYSQLDCKIDYSDVAGGYNHLYRAGGSGCISSFGDGTDPSSRLYDGSASGVSVKVTTASADTMSVTVGSQTSGISSLAPDKASPQYQYRAVRWTCVATGANCTYQYDITKNGTRVDGTAGYSADATFAWTPAEAGDYTVTVNVKTDTETYTASAPFTVLADAKAPVISVKAGGAAVQSGAVKNADFTATASDPDGGVIATYSYTLNGGAAATPWPASFTQEGAYVLTATDRAGNTATTAFTIDRTPPVISAVCGSPLASGMTAPTPVTVTVTDANPGAYTATRNGAAVAWPAGGVFSETGVYAITAQDAAGNKTSFHFGILANGDKLAVTADGVYLTDGGCTAGNVTVTLDAAWSVRVTAGGQTQDAWQGSQPHTFTAEGAYTALATDGAGNTVTMRFIIDRTAPKLSAKNAAGAAVAQGSVQKSAVTVAIADASAVTKTAKRNGAAYAWPSGNRFAQDGKYTLTVTDALGHAATFSFSIDAAGPVITVKASGANVPNGGFARASATVTVTDSSAFRKSVTKNGRAVSWPSGGVFTTDGIYIVTATDALQRKATFKFTVDKTLPAITGRQSSGAGAYNGGYYRLSVTIKVTDLYLAGKSVTKNGKAVAWPSGGVFSTSGKYVVTAWDKAGNRRTFTFTVDKVKPSVSVKTTSGVTVHNYGTARGGAVVAVSDTNLASKTMKLGTKTLAWPSGGKVTASGAYSVTAKDKAGNTTAVRFYVK